MQIRKVAILTAVLVTLGAAARSGAAATYSDVIVYGDSLSDNGNLYAASGGTVPLPPYYNGRFSNGPVAVEQLASMLGVPLIDFAWGGATSGVGNSADGGTQTSLGALHLPGMLTELAGSSVTSAQAANSLFVVWGGANDYPVGSPVTAAADIDAIVTSLESKGATHILVPGLPDLGLTPAYYGDAAATLFSEQFNQALQALLPANATYFDTFGLLDAIAANPSKYGFSNVTTGCYPGSYLTPGLTPCSNPNQYLFWDDFHPTTAADALLANAFDAAVGGTSIAPTPEPSSIVTLATGVVGLLGLARAKAKR